MILKQPDASLKVTLLAGPIRASRALVLSQLIEEARPRRVAVVTFDPQRQSLTTNHSVPLRRPQPKQIRIAQPGFSTSFRADLYLELNAIVQERSVEEVIIELYGEVEMSGAHDTLLNRFPGGINLANIARLTRSIMAVETKSLCEEFWTDQAASEPEKIGNLPSECTHSHAHRLVRSIECADALAVTDHRTADPHTLAKSLRLLKSINPTAAFVDTQLKKLETGVYPSFPDEAHWHDKADEASPRFQSQWTIRDADSARLVVRAGWPFHPQRFHHFVQGEWRGLLRGRGQVWIASQPDIRYLWSQVGRIGVLSVKPTMPLSGQGELADERWPQRMTFVGPEVICEAACRHLEECLLTKEEFELGPRLWRAFSDPLRSEESRNPGYFS